MKQNAVTTSAEANLAAKTKNDSSAIIVQKTAATESRIRVRNWLMLADQSILQNSIINNTTIPITNEPATPQPVTPEPVIRQPNTRSHNKVYTNKTNNKNTVLTEPTGDGITNANLDATIRLANTGDGGSTYDGADENTTEVIVKIEHSISSLADESENENDPFNYDLKISSPMSWAFDSVKIEGSEFEEVTEMEQDENTADADIDDCGGNENENDNGEENNEGDEATQTTVRHNVRRVYSGAGKHRSGIRKRVLAQSVSGALNLPPDTTITRTGGSVVKRSATTVSGVTSIGMSDDKKYRILIQNQRMRKESLEHSEDMIYNADIEKPWVCKNCNRNYKWKNSLKCHLKNECGQPPRFFCSKLCGYATNVHSNLKRHLNTKCRDKLDDESEKVVEKIESPDKTHYTLVINQQD